MPSSAVQGMFKFAFNNTGEDEVPYASQNSLTEELPAKLEPITAAACAQPNSPFDYLVLCDSTLKLRKSIASPGIHLSPSGADIVPYKYEGGYKLWEGAVDLVEYLFRERPCNFKGKKVLELGAGHALPSILAARLGAAQIDINDYNAEVLRDVTMPNMFANSLAKDVEIRYFSGGWRSLPSVLGARYDIILSAETVYASHQSESLAECLLKTLRDDGIAFVAAKSYYFGVGGGIRAFDKDIQKCATKLGVPIYTSVVREIRDGVSNVREILQIQRG